MILRTGKVSRYRSIFFVIYAVSFVIVFISDLISTRGSMALTQDIIEANQTPLCPVAIPQLILPAIFRGLLIFPTQIVNGHYGGFWAILAMWVVGILVLGRGWCSWGCFYGGIDEGFTKILRRPLIPTGNLPPQLRYLPHAVLFLVVVLSFLALEPIYCSWLCPLKLVTEYPAVDTPGAYLQAVIFITLGMGLLIILPLLTGKRTHCALFCPLGAMNSLASPINPYRVRIDAATCVACGRCKGACPTFSITDASLGRHRVESTCTRCGACMDACPRGAISYGLVGITRAADKQPAAEPSRLKRILGWLPRTVRELLEARTLFVFTAILFGAILSGSFVPQAMQHVYLLIKGGMPLLGLIGLEVF
ncbi:MAG: 4Fe-4S binding protein [bacterium]|nr:4Fe-4S binding protein [bacterium]